MVAGRRAARIARDGLAAGHAPALGKNQQGGFHHRHTLVATPNHRIGAIRKVLIWQGAWELHRSDTQTHLTPVP